MVRHHAPEHRVQHGPTGIRLLLDMVSELFVIAQPPLTTEMESFNEDGSL